MEADESGNKENRKRVHEAGVIEAEIQIFPFFLLS
jgi:hypothetical protein